MKRPNHTLLLVAACALVATAASAQTGGRQTGTVVADAPIYVQPEASQLPLRVAAPVEQQGEWVEVESNDPQSGPHVGWIQRSLLKFSTEGLKSRDESVRDAAQPAAPPPSGLSSFPEAETTFGWQYLRPIHPSGGLNSWLGFDVSAAYNLTSWFGFALDAGVSHFSDQNADFGETEYALLGGTRFALRQAGLIVPYAQFLLGYARLNSELRGQSQEGQDLFVIQPGAGVDIGKGRFAARVEVSWRRLFSQVGASNQLRVVAGLVIRSGPRRDE